MTIASGVLLLLLGLGYAFYTPPYQVPDEPAHFFRVYQLAQGLCKEPPTSMIPVDIGELMHRFPNQLETSDAIDDLSARLAQASRQPRSNRVWQISANATAAGYSCLTYLPSTAGVLVANALRLPIIDVLYAARIGNVVIFTLAATVALLLLPLALRPLALLLVGMPMTLAEAGSSAQDSVVNAVSFLFVAYVAHLAWGGRTEPIARREIAILVGLALVLSQCKLNVLLLPLVFLVPRGRWRNGVRTQLTVVAGTLAGSAAAFLAWQHFGAVTAESSPLAAQDYAANLRFVLSDPGLVLQRYADTLQLNWWFYLDSFVGRLGWLSVELPSALVVAYAAAIAIAAAAAPAPAALTMWRRGLSVAVIGVLIGTTFFVFWVIASPELITQYATGTGYIEGVQGRYLIPYALPFGFAVAGVLPRWLRVPGPNVGIWALAACAALVSAASGAAYASLYWNYYYPQQEVRAIPYRLRHPALSFNDQFIHQVGSASVPDQIFYIVGGRRYWIETPRWFRKHNLVGIRMPIVPPEVVRRIPIGDTIYDPDTLFHSTPAAMKYVGQLTVDGRGDIWLVTHGVRHRIVDPGYIRRNAYPLRKPSAAEFADIPVGDPIENFHYLDGALIQATDAEDPVERARVYAVQAGRKQWITDSRWLARHGKRTDQIRPLPASVVDRIPEGAPLP